MSAAERVPSASDETALQAYHDGELSRFARWRFERRLRRSPELRRGLQDLALVSQLVRESEPLPPGPDLWSEIARRLPTADAERATVATPTERAAWLGSLFRPMPAAIASAAAAVALAIFLTTGETRPAGGVVSWVDGGGRSVMVLEGEADLTIIWVLESSSDGARRGGLRDTA